jgi:hypothetical protein
MWYPDAESKFEAWPVTARGRARTHPRVFEGPDLLSPVVDALSSHQKNGHYKVISNTKSKVNSLANRRLYEVTMSTTANLIAHS